MNCANSINESNNSNIIHNKIKFHKFWTFDPNSWFKLLETLFENNSITDDINSI